MSVLGRLLKLGGHVPRDAGARLVVVDTETTGLDARRDGLLAIGAVSVDAQGAVPGDSFEVVLHNDRAGDAANVAVHGIGYDTQSRGVPAASAIAAFRAYVEDARCVGFHADFDRQVLRRAFASAGVPFDERPWLDLAQLAGALESERRGAGKRTLDDWLRAFRIETDARHNAAGDALATAELFLRFRAKAAAHGARGFPALLRLAGQGKWLSGGH